MADASVSAHVNISSMLEGLQSGNEECPSVHHIGFIGADVIYVCCRTEDLIRPIRNENYTFAALCHIIGCWKKLSEEAICISLISISR